MTKLYVNDIKLDARESYDTCVGCEHKYNPQCYDKCPECGCKDLVLHLAGTGRLREGLDEIGITVRVEDE